MKILEVLPPPVVQEKITTLSFEEMLERKGYKLVDGKLILGKVAICNVEDIKYTVVARDNYLESTLILLVMLSLIPLLVFPFAFYKESISWLIAGLLSWGIILAWFFILWSHLKTLRYNNLSDIVQFYYFKEGKRVPLGKSLKEVTR